MNNLKEIEATFREVFPNSKVVARRISMADKTIVEGQIANVSATKHSIEVNGTWYKFSNKDWEANQSDVNKGSNCRFETSSSTREYQGKTYETHWVNGFNPLTDLDDAPMDLDFSEEVDAPQSAEEPSHSSKPTKTRFSTSVGGYADELFDRNAAILMAIYKTSQDPTLSKIVKVLNLSTKDLQIMTLGATKIEISEWLSNADQTEEGNDDIPF